MNLLIIGGTRFLGRALVRAAQAGGHRLTLFNRGKSNPQLFPDIEQITGDRMVEFDQLPNQTWDAVIDTCGYEPAAVRLSAGKLANSVGVYCFISSISVYADFSQIGIDETAPVAQLAQGEPESFKMENYGSLKALTEQAAEQTLPGRVLNIRPGLIVGEYDPTDRFTYWPWRISQGGDVLAPGRPGHPIQFIDVHDLAEWTIHMLEAGQTGVYNATGPQPPVNLGDLLETCLQLTHREARLHWLNEAFLLENGVQPWAELPLWLPESNPESAGMEQVNVNKAIEAGLTFRTIAATVQSTLAWAASRPAEYAWRAGLTREKETALLQKAGIL